MLSGFCSAIRRPPVAPVRASFSPRGLPGANPNYGRGSNFCVPFLLRGEIGRVAETQNGRERKRA